MINPEKLPFNALHFTIFWNLKYVIKFTVSTNMISFILETKTIKIKQKIRFS